MSQLDTSVELCSRDDYFLTNVAYLVLQVKLNGQVVEETGLTPRNSSPGVWDADKTLVLYVS
jgi:hypothetical protein